MAARRPGFTALAVGTLASALVFAALQERVFLVPGFHFGGYMTVLTQLTFALCALAERGVRGDLRRKAPLKLYLMLSAFTVAGMLFTNWSLSFINYPTRVMFKASKVVPVMAVGFFVGKRTSAAEVANACLLVAGICVFMYGNLKGSPSFNPLGIVLITLGVLADALTANIEEAYFFKAHQCTHAEVMCFASLIGAVFSSVLILATGELARALAHTRQHPYTPLLIATFSLAGYVSVSCVLLMIKHYGATSAEMVKSSRKVISIVLSFALFKKPWNALHVGGGAIFAAAIAAQVALKRRKRALAKRQQRALQRGEEEAGPSGAIVLEVDSPGRDLEGGGRHRSFVRRGTSASASASALRSSSRTPKKRASD